MTKGEVDAFEKKYGYKPAHFRVAADALAIYVNKDNPIPCLTMQQVDQIFSATRQGSGFWRPRDHHFGSKFLERRRPIVEATLKLHQW